ncbi:peptidoglycan-binding domain-containing protein [Clostridioides difficile]|uniref:peptidoglycan-binding domain-containing protein n=1 Tax=Clostridioides difficile TaxID=1496 RepID=UPI000D1ED334|nr:peptidoglycan-binding domain-containing protein [Clostridioides difficile]HBE9444579.1 peptidoglycan-binding protein [Clostridioides difficile]
MLKKVLTLFCCLMLTFTSIAFAEQKDDGSNQNKSSIISFKSTGYTFKYETAPEQVKDYYEQKCKELNIDPDTNAEIFIPDDRSILSLEDENIGTYSQYYGKYDPDKATITISGDKNYTISTRTLVGYGHVTKGNNVHCVQLMLRQLSYDLGLDSSFGPATYNAVKHFQRGHALTSDGVVGYNTYDVMANLLRM